MSSSNPESIEGYQYIASLHSVSIYRNTAPSWWVFERDGSYFYFHHSELDEAWKCYPFCYLTLGAAQDIIKFCKTYVNMHA